DRELGDVKAVQGEDQVGRGLEGEVARGLPQNGAALVLHRGARGLGLEPQGEGVGALYRGRLGRALGGRGGGQGGPLGVAWRRSGAALRGGGRGAVVAEQGV